MKTHKYLAGILFVTAAAASGAACAADTNFYLGFSAGQARPSFDGTPLIAGGSPVTYDSSDSAWKVFAGYQFNPYIGIEGNYVKLGTYAANAPTLFTDVNINAWGASLVGTLPLAKTVALFGKGGMAYTRESRGTCSVLCQTFNTSFSANNVWSPTFGIGLRYDFHPNWNVRGEVEHYTKIGSSDNTFGGTLTMYTLGLAYKF